MLRAWIALCPSGSRGVGIDSETARVGMRGEWLVMDTGNDNVMDTGRETVLCAGNHIASYPGRPGGPHADAHSVLIQASGTLTVESGHDPLEETGRGVRQAFRGVTSLPYLEDAEDAGQSAGRTIERPECHGQPSPPRAHGRRAPAEPRGPLVLDQQSASTVTEADPLNRCPNSNSRV